MVFYHKNGWAIKYFLGLDQVAIYSIGSRVSMILLFFSITFRTAWGPIAMEHLHKKQYHNFYILTAKLFLGVGFALAIVISLSAPHIIDPRLKSFTQLMETI